MKKSTLYIVIGLIIILFTSLVILSQPEELDFEQIELASDNQIVNNSSLPKFYDTIISVGLDVNNIKGVTVFVEELSDKSKNNFSGELEAHVRYYNGDFYLFANNFSKSRALEILSHEIVHMKQYLDGSFVYEDEKVYWHGELFDLQGMDYEVRPWEKEAYDTESEIASLISQILTNKQ